MPKIIALTALLSLVVFIFYLFFYSPPTQEVPVKIKNKTFSLEVARTPAQQSRGLMYRSNLCPSCGMLFIFNQEGIYPFWMKNTPLPLDIIWLSQNGTVVDIKNGQPQDTTLLTNSKPAKYVIETNPNTTNLKIGDKINL